MKTETVSQERLKESLKRFSHSRTIAPSLVVALILASVLSVFELIHNYFRPDITLFEAYVQTAVICAFIGFLASVYVLKKIFITQDLLLSEIENHKAAQQELHRALTLEVMNKLELSKEITERKRIEGELRANIEFVEGIIQSAQVIILVLDPDGKIVRFNPFTEKLTRYNLAEVRGKDWFSIFLPPLFQSKIRERFSRLIEVQSMDGVLNPIMTKDGNELQIEWFNRVLKNEKDEVIGVLAIGHDLTLHLAYEEELKEGAEKLKFFAYSIAHDLKSPAIGLHGITNLLHRRYAEELDADGQRFCDQIVLASEKIVALVDKINLYIQTRESNLELETIKLSDILKTVKEEFSPRLSLRQITWVEPEDDKEIRVDRLSMIRIMRNIVDNALKYGGDELSEIRVDYQLSNEHHIIGICDDGRGIDKEKCERLFDAFYRDSSTSKEAIGAGLGLSIVKEMAEKHGGKAWAEAQQDRGVGFYISISKKL